jgi:predicted nucleic acid-binding protein
MNEPGYLFDTGALLDIYHGRERIRPYFDGILDGSLTVCISPISEAELWLGLRPDELERHESLLAFFVVLPLVSAAGRLAGQWMKHYQAQGLGWMDALLAATAANAGLALLTRDRRLAGLLSAEAEFVTYG